MAAEEETDTSRKTVKTFVPAYQKDEWKRHADELDMSQSEFVRTMVQAGRRDFEIETPVTSRSDSGAGDDGANGTGGGDATGAAGADSADSASVGGSGAGVSAASGGADAGSTAGNGAGGETGVGAGGGTSVGAGDLENQILSVLSASEHLSWDELVEELTSNIEDRLDETIQRLQAENRVRYSGRHGGYALLGGNDGN